MFNTGKPWPRQPKTMAELVDKIGTSLEEPPNGEFFAIEAGTIPQDRYPDHPIMRAALTILADRTGDSRQARIVWEVANIDAEFRNVVLTLYEREIGSSAGKVVTTMLQEAEDASIFKVEKRMFRQGKTEGKAEILLGLLAKKFGKLAPAIRKRVKNASAAELDAWALRIFDSPSAETVIDGTSLA